MVRKPQACKPDSVPSPEGHGGHHLSVPTVAGRDRAAYPSPNPSPEAWTSRPWPHPGGWGPEIYVAFQHARFTPLSRRRDRAWALTPRFHPCRRGSGGGHSLWHFLFPPKRDPAVHRCAALCCPDFPPPVRRRVAMARPVVHRLAGILSDARYHEGTSKPSKPSCRSVVTEEDLGGPEAEKGMVHVSV